MRKFLLLFTVCLRIALSGLSQSTSEPIDPFKKVEVTVGDLQKLYIGAKQGDASKILIDTLNKHISILENQIAKLDLAIEQAKANSETDNKLIQNLEKQKKELENKVALSKDKVDELTRKLKWANVKTIGVAIVGLILTILALLKHN